MYVWLRVKRCTAPSIPWPIDRSIPPIHTKTQVIQTDPYLRIIAGRSISEFWRNPIYIYIHSIVCIYIYMYVNSFSTKIGKWYPTRILTVRYFEKVRNPFETEFFYKTSKKDATLMTAGIQRHSNYMRIYSYPLVMTNIAMENHHF